LIYLSLCFKISFEEILSIFISASIGILYYIYPDASVYNVM